MPAENMETGVMSTWNRLPIPVDYVIGKGARQAGKDGTRNLGADRASYRMMMTSIASKMALKSKRCLDRFDDQTSRHDPSLHEWTGVVSAFQKSSRFSGVRYNHTHFQSERQGGEHVDCEQGNIVLNGLNNR